MLVLFNLNKSINLNITEIKIMTLIDHQLRDVKL